MIINEEHFKRTQVGITPKKNTAALFLLLLLHKGEFCNENKQIFVMGIKV